MPLAISSVVIDRIIALFALAVMGGMTLPLVINHLDISGWLVIPTFLFLAALGVWVLLNLDSVVQKIPFLKSMHWLEQLLKNIRLIIKSPKPLSLSVFYAVVAHITFCAATYLLSDSLGYHISFIDALTLVPWVLLVAIIPISIGGWGLREAGMVFMLGLVGVPQAAALALSVQLGLITILVSLPAGILWMVNRRYLPQ
jgi:hypothetical protein